MRHRTRRPQPDRPPYRDTWGRSSSGRNQRGECVGLVGAMRRIRTMRSGRSPNAHDVEDMRSAASVVAKQEPRARRRGTEVVHKVWPPDRRATISLIGAESKTLWRMLQIGPAQDCRRRLAAANRRAWTARRDPQLSARPSGAGRPRSSFRLALPLQPSVEPKHGHRREQECPRSASQLCSPNASNSWSPDRIRATQPRVKVRIRPTARHVHG